MLTNRTMTEAASLTRTLFSLVLALPAEHAGVCFWLIQKGVLRWLSDKSPLSPQSEDRAEGVAVSF